MYKKIAGVFRGVTDKTYDEFIKAVKSEVESLKKHVTKEELSCLNADTLSPINGYLCIYGQLTGGCFTLRAKELVGLCATKVFNAETNQLYQKKFEAVEKYFGDDFKGQIWPPDCSDNRDYEVLTALEGYLCLKDSKGLQIISYLRRETKVLTLE